MAGDRVAAAGSSPGERQDVAIPRHDGLVTDIVSRQLLNVEDDVAFQIDTLGEGGRERIEVAHANGAIGGVAAAGFGHVDDGVVDEGEEIPLFGRGGLVAIKKEIPDDGDLGGVPAVITAGDGTRGIRRAVFMRVQEDVPFDPGIGAVEVEHVVAGSGEDVVVKLDDRLFLFTVAAGEIDDVVVAAGAAEEAILDDAPTTGLNAADAMD